MQFAKTVCKPNSVVAIIPVGLPVKLQYNEHGVLQKATIGFDIELDPMYEDADVKDFNYNEFFHAIQTKVPNSISTTGGTTWVYGVFYSDRIPCNEGVLPKALFKSYIDDIIAGGQYQFYAGYVTSLAVSFKGPLIIRNFLQTAKFNLLPQMVISLAITEEALQNALRPSYVPFNPSFIAGFFIFEDLGCRYASNGLIQVNVTKEPKPYVDKDGYLKGDVITEAKNTMVFNYSALVRHEVSKGATLLLERDADSPNYIIRATRVGTGIEKVINNIGKDIKCPVCGKIYRVGDDDAPIQCDDPHCLSRLYNESVKMLTALGLPSLDYEAYKKLVDSKKILCLVDILDTPPYADQNIEATLSTALYAATPIEVVPNFDIFERFANKCNNKVESVMYYLENPLRIETDLDIVDPIVRRFAKWLQDPCNVSTLTSLFGRVKIIDKVQKFDGDPIFRGNTIAITGRFKRGSFPEIESILMSYAAKVVCAIAPGQELPQVVVVGSTNENISGEIIQKARIHNIPVVEEDEFFTRYEIDQDLARNLL